MTRLLTAAALIVVLLAAAQASAYEIRIRARAALDVEASAAGTVAQVAGALRDDLGRGLPQRQVVVRIDSRRSGQAAVTRSVHTDSRGRFGVQEELPPGDYEVFVRFDETDHLDGIADSATIRLDPAPVEVRVFAPALVYGRKNPAWVTARATAAGVPYQGAAAVMVAGESVGQLELDASGRGTFDVAPFLVVGPNEITVRTPGSAYRDEAEASTEMRFAANAVVEAQLEERLVRLKRGLAVSGRVSDAYGPLEGVRITGRIWAETVYDPDAVATSYATNAVTDDDGRFVAFFAASQLADGRWRGTATFVPPLGEPEEVEAGTAEIDTRAYRVAVNGFGLMALFLGALVVFARVGSSLRRRWQQWLESREKRARQTAALKEVETIVPVFLDEPDFAPKSADPRTDIGGVVWDDWSGKPIAEAELSLNAEGGDRILSTSNARGRFAFVDVQPGSYVLTATRHGYIRGVLKFDVPHDGRLSNFRLDLVAVPVKIRRLYGTVMERTVGQDLWGRLSPREIEERLDELIPTSAADAEADRRVMRDAVLDRLAGSEDITPVAAIAAFTEVVEESYFSGRVYGEDAFMFARALALELTSAPVAAPVEGEGA